MIGYSTKPAVQQDFARRTPGAQAIEAVDLKDLTLFASRLNIHHADALDEVADFAQAVMSNVGATDYIRRVDPSVGEPRGSLRAPRKWLA